MATQKNPYLINTNKLPETATVSYYDVETDQNLTAEEWRKRLNFEVVPDEIIIINESGGYRSWKAGVDYPSYGPGFLEFMEDVGNVTWQVTKFTGRVVAVGAAGAAIVSTGGLAAPLIGGGVYLGGKVVKEIAKDCDNEFFEGVGDFVEDVGLDGLTGGLFNLGTKTAGSLAAREIARHGRKMTNGARVLIRAGKVIKIGNKIYSIYDNTLDEIEYYANAYHGAHKRRSSYDSDCPICRGDFD